MRKGTIAVVVVVAVMCAILLSYTWMKWMNFLTDQGYDVYSLFR